MRHEGTLAELAKQFSLYRRGATSNSTHPVELGQHVRTRSSFDPRSLEHPKNANGEREADIWCRRQARAPISLLRLFAGQGATDNNGRQHAGNRRRDERRLHNAVTSHHSRRLCAATRRTRNSRLSATTLSIGHAYTRQPLHHLRGVSLLYGQVPPGPWSGCRV